MPANFLHGVETIEVEKGARPVRVVKSATILLVGTAPRGKPGELTLCLSERDAAAFGRGHAGFTIPQALAAIYDQGAGTVLVLNVLDSSLHKSAVENENVSFDSSGRARLRHPAVMGLELKSLDGGRNYVAGVDYQLDADSGELSRLKAGAIASLATVRANYSYADPAKVTAADIIGGVDAAGRRTGLKAAKDAFSAFGFLAKLVIAPAYCTQASVAAEMVAVAEQTGAFALIDAPIGVSVQQALQGRGPGGAINFNVGSERAILCYPHLKVWDDQTNAPRLEPFSQRLAGVIARKDLDKGYWWSPSNTGIQGVIGIERPLTALLDDANAEVNLLNEAGIVTVFNAFGSGWEVWGNRSAAWPVLSHIRNFIPVRRTADIINESLRYFSKQYMDRPLDQPLIDSLVGSINAFFRKLIGDGAILGGHCWFDPARNVKEELAAGHLLLQYKFTPPPPMERLSLEAEISDEYLLNLKGER
ncbi:phage tail sheath subtilisin-like domain-containing protein [Chromobacterium subtsugae]|uniref:phage tail sheath subtilisin-like domain-containing protein n=1 Tax=Chromobacterium subtsugae TaxID=251747 RepID=UPI0006413826|nr:phage tail sheath subtilisin-like domain-containing protein [Chromobacterium subtsugae]